MARTARYYLMGEESAPGELWVACHGYGQLAASFARALRPLVAPGRLVAVPEALNRFYLDDPRRVHGPESPVGATWMTREDRDQDITDYVAYLDTLVAELLGELPAAIPVNALGFSQGVATAARWAALGRTPLRRLVLWGGGLPQDLPHGRGAALFHGAAVTIVAGRGDQVVPAEALIRAAQRLERDGIPVRLEEHEGGHLLSSALLARIGD